MKNILACSPERRKELEEEQDQILERIGGNGYIIG